MSTAIQRIGDLSVNGVFIFHTQKKKFIYVNEPFARLFNTHREQLMKDPSLVLPFIQSEDNFYLLQRYSELLAENTIRANEFRIQLPDGNTRHLSCDAYMLDEELIAGFLTDVTQEKEHEDYIVNYGARKDTLLDMMTHNLSGPLLLSQNILRWMQQTFKDRTPGEISSQLRLIQESTQECLDIVNDFLREEHLESERIYVKKTRFDVVKRVMATMEKLVISNRDKKFRIITKLENLNISTDSVKFFQVIHNLVSNAIKFTASDGEIDIIIEESESTFIIRVRDNGIGIPAALQRDLFLKHTSSGRSGLNHEKSSGMGLHIVKMLVTLLGGTVWFETEENKGTTFSVELPKD